MPTAHLYLNPRWQLDDIVRVIERTQEDKVEVVSHHNITPGFFHFNLKKSQRSIAVFINSCFPTGTVTYLSLRSDEQAHKIFRDIAEVFGGVIEWNDCDGKCEIFNGNLWDENGLAYHLLYAVVEDGIKPGDIKALIKSYNDWRDKYRDEQPKIVVK